MPKSAYAYLRGPVYELCKQAFPQHVHATPTGETLRVVDVAPLLDLTPEGLYKRFRANRISPRIAKRLVDRSEGRITLEQTMPFLFHGI